MNTLRSAVAAIAALLLAACAAPGAVDVPDRPADAVGTLAASSDMPDGAGFRLTVASDEYSYFTDGSLFFDEETVLVGAEGQALALADIRAGMTVEVWTGGCRESYPVQCDVTHLRVNAGD